VSEQELEAEFHNRAAAEVLKNMTDRELEFELRKARGLKNFSDEELEIELRKARAFNREWSRRDAANRQAEHDKHEAITREREEAKKKIAAQWDRVFASHGLKLKARIQITRWRNGSGDPEIWIECGDGREKNWQALIDVLAAIPGKSRKKKI